MRRMRVPQQQLVDSGARVYLRERNTTTDMQHRRALCMRTVRCCVRVYLPAIVAPLLFLRLTTVKYYSRVRLTHNTLARYVQLFNSARTWPIMQCMGGGGGVVWWRMFSSFI